MTILNLSAIAELFTEDFRADVVREARATSEVASIIPDRGLMSTARSLRIPMVASGASPGWISESELKPVSNPSFSEFTMTPKELANISRMSDEAVRSAGPNLEGTLRSVLQTDIAHAVEDALINGTGADKRPIGLDQLAGVQTIDGSSTGFDEIDALDDAISSLNKQGFRATHVIMNSDAIGTYAKMRDTDGRHYFPTLRDDRRLRGLTMVETDKIATATQATTLIVVAASELWWCNFDPLEIVGPTNLTTIDDGGTLYSAFQRDEQHMRWKMQVDFAVPRPTSVLKIENFSVA